MSDCRHPGREELNNHQKTELKELLSQLDARARKELISRASAMRGKYQTANDRLGHRPIEWFMLELLSAQEPSGPTGVVIGVDKTQCVVRIESEEIVARTKVEVAPGDEVCVVDGAVSQVMERRTTLVRSGQLVAANVDVFVVVVSVVSPPLHPRLIDRYLAAIQQGGATAALCLNKSDLGVSDEDERAIDTYRSILPIFETSAECGRGICELREFLGARLCALVGHSGVGKSSLLNALVGRSIAEAGRVDDVGKGRHTTTRSTLHEINGLRILDTPGIREFVMRFDSPYDVAEGFVEIARMGAACQYSDCLHLSGSRSCAVLEGVHYGAIRRERYDSYVKLLAESFPSVMG